MSNRIAREFLFEDIIRKLIIHPEWRLGQTVFNVLWSLFPDIVNEYRGSIIDPFFNDEVALQFFDTIYDELLVRWKEQEEEWTKK